ncbi:MAG TPA: Glu/Leu/Phe/Val dehydrogenase dimerization domain-containing protein [Polyangiaceae bacterium]|nr:Glu/Leu/Phe/Val dehydrogenase dimerization domain-containing protein [Polyangiaceae bacterium]
MTSPTLDTTIEDFVRALAREGTRRAYLVLRNGGLQASHPFLEPLARAVEASPDFDAHEGVFFELGRATGTLLAATLHRTVRGQGAGGVRHWRYASIGAFVRDGLRLSRGMGRKNALAGLWWGGGKGVIAREPGERYRDRAYRDALYDDYGRFVTSLRGSYVTAEDVGTTPPDMARVFGTTRFTTCIPESVGGSGNPSPATAVGVVCAMEGALDHLGLGTLAGKTIAMQGAGNVGSAMIQTLLERGAAKIVASDVDAALVRELGARFAGKPVTVRAVLPDDDSIFDEPCDVFAPNALGAVLSPRTIPRLGCRVVCGAANNQLEDEARDDHALAGRKITYVPDFVANRMGIVSCANEQYGSLPEDPAIVRHFGRTWENAVYVVTRRILREADETGKTPAEAANRLADALAAEPHPVFPHRGKALVEALVRERWEDARS